MDWSALDFAVFGSMIFGVAIAYALVRRKTRNAAGLEPVTT